MNKKTVFFSVLVTIFVFSSCKEDSEVQRLRDEKEKLQRSLDSLYSPEKMDSMKKALEDELKELDTLKKQRFNEEKD
jgi:uncharacterized protein YlxW (UPF0749 family)